ncbi:hypothetical protein MRX96_018851 [Rhipicephalus microplus]
MNSLRVRALPGRLGQRERAFLVRVIWFVLGFVFALWCCYDMAARSTKRWDSREGEAFLFVAILSSHKTEHLRNAARQTWLKLAVASERRVVYKFFFNDVVVIYEAADTYEKLTSKLVYSLQWVVKHYYFDFLLKLDDDSFARVDAIADELAQWKQDHPGRELYWGYFAGNAPVFTSGKWAERTWYLRDGYYLPYARGGGYVLSLGAARHVGTMGVIIFEQYSSEDVSVGVWTAPLRLERWHDRRFDTEYRSRGCFNSYLVTHKQTASMMYEMYRNLQQDRKPCQREARWRLSYEYNWSVPPVQCCVRNMTDATLRRPRTLRLRHSL